MGNPRGRPPSCTCGICRVCLRREKERAARDALAEKQGQGASPAPASRQLPPAPAPVQGDGWTSPPMPNMSASFVLSTEPNVRPGEWTLPADDAPMAVLGDVAGGYSPPDPEAEAREGYESKLADATANLSPGGQMVAGALVANFKRNRELCAQIGKPWPEVASSPMVDEAYLEACKTTLAMVEMRFPGAFKGGGKAAPVVVCVGGQVGSTAAVALARRSGELDPVREDDEEPEDAELEHEAANPNKAAGPAAWGDE